MQQERRARSETSVLLASTFTGMLHSVGERVQGTQPERERERELVVAEKQEEMEEKWRTDERRWRNVKCCEEGWQRQIKSERKEGDSESGEAEKGPATGAQKGPELKGSEGIPNFTRQRKEQRVFKCLVSLHSGLCECQVSGRLPIKL